MLRAFSSILALCAILAADPAIASTTPAEPSPTEPAQSTPPRNPVLAAVGAASTDKAIADAYATLATPLWTTADGLSAKGSALTTILAAAADFGLDATAFRGPTAGSQAERELALTKAALLYANHARGGRIADPSKLSTMYDMKPVLPETAAVLETLATADDVAAALLAFHPRHAGFTALQKALVAARATNAPAETLARLHVNLERWRWLPADLGAFHIRNNVPEQITRVVKAGEIIHTDRIVVGKPGHSTPIISADMKYVIFHPSWGVPDGIKRKEIGPMLARASGRATTSFFDFGSGIEGGNSGGTRAAATLARKQLRAFHNGKEVNADQVDWKTVDVRQFTFTQPPSSKNVLGVVKFRFPNKFDVYMHDTQDKHLFSHPVRAYSHGCMRVQQPMKLAGVILGHDKGWTQEKVDAFIPGGRSADITLSTPVTVHLTYFTVTADETGKLSTHGDIYGWDARVAAALGQTASALTPAKTTAQPAARSQARQVAAPAAARPTAAAWNPFAN